MLLPAAGGPGGTSGLELLLQVLSSAGGGGVNSSSLQPVLLLFSSQCFMIAHKMFPFCLAQLAASALLFRVARFSSLF